MKTFKKGDKCKYIGTVVGKSASGLGLAANTEVTIYCKVAGYTNKYYVITPSGSSSSWVYDYELQLSVVTEEEILSNIAKLEEEIKLEKTKLEYLKLSGSKAFDEREFKIFSAMKILGIDSLEKAREIAKIFESC